METGHRFSCGLACVGQRSMSSCAAHGWESPGLCSGRHHSVSRPAASRRLPEGPAAQALGPGVAPQRSRRPGCWPGLWSRALACPSGPGMSSPPTPPLSARDLLWGHCGWPLGARHCLQGSWLRHSPEQSRSCHSDLLSCSLVGTGGSDVVAFTFRVVGLVGEGARPSSRWAFCRVSCPAA